MTLDLTDRTVCTALAGTPDRPEYRVDGGRLHLLDRLVIVPDGGQHGRGYLWAERAIDPHDWFFGAHFFQDPVMPGSLGVEAMLQALKAHAIQLDLGRQFRSPRFVQPVQNQTVWKYRAQILPLDQTLSLELHIRFAHATDERVTILADASLWRDGLRIYEVTGLALGIEEAAR